MQHARLSHFSYGKPLDINVFVLAGNCLSQLSSCLGSVWEGCEYVEIKSISCEHQLSSAPRVLSHYCWKHLSVNSPTAACTWLLRQRLEDACGASAKMAFEKLGYWSDNDFPVFVCKFLGQLNIHFCECTLSSLTISVHLFPWLS